MPKHQAKDSNKRKETDKESLPNVPIYYCLKRVSRPGCRKRKCHRLELRSSEKPRQLESEGLVEEKGAQKVQCLEYCIVHAFKETTQG